MQKRETPRQKKINTSLQQEIALLIQNAIRKGTIYNLIISVTKVQVSSDLSIAKIYLSIFPNDKALFCFKNLKENRNKLRHDLSQKMKHQLRKIPELFFYLDDSLDYIEAIERDLSEGENPLNKTSDKKTNEGKI